MMPYFCVSGCCLRASRLSCERDSSETRASGTSRVTPPFVSSLFAAPASVCPGVRITDPRNLSLLPVAWPRHLGAAATATAAGVCDDITHTEALLSWFRISRKSTGIDVTVFFCLLKNSRCVIFLCTCISIYGCWLNVSVLSHKARLLDLCLIPTYHIVS